MSPHKAPSRLWLVAAEWVVGDDGRDIHLGEVLEREARLADPHDDGDLQPVLAQILENASDRSTMYAWHADDPEPPVTIRCVVVRIWSLPLPSQSGAHGLDGVREVAVATVDWKVDRYLFQVEGNVTQNRDGGTPSV